MSRRRFLLKCRMYDYLPKHLYNTKNKLNYHHFNSTYCKKEHNKSINRFIIATRNLEIKDLCTHIKFLEKNKIYMKESLKISNTDINIWQDIFVHENQNFEFFNKKYNDIFYNKFNLIADIQNTHSSDNNNNNNNELSHLKSKWFINLSNREIPNKVMDLVSLGDGFSYVDSINKSDVIDTIKNFEHTIQNIEYHNNRQKNIIKIVKTNNNYSINKDNNNSINNDLDKNIRSELTECIKRAVRINSHIPIQDSIMHDKINATSKFLKTNKDSIFTLADKSNVTVWTDKCTYDDIFV